MVVPRASSSQERNARRIRRASAIAGAVIVLIAGGFVTLVLFWWASFNNGAWAVTPSERRQLLTGAAVVFALTIGIFGLITWRGFHERDERRPR